MPYCKLPAVALTASPKASPDTRSFTLRLLLPAGGFAAQIVRVQADFNVDPGVDEQNTGDFREILPYVGGAYQLCLFHLGAPKPQAPRRNSTIDGTSFGYKRSAGFLMVKTAH